MTQTSRPSSDKSNPSGWRRNTGVETNLYDAINESVADDADWIEKPPDPVETEWLTHPPMRVLPQPYTGGFVHAAGKDRYIAPDGNDSGDGSLGQPWKTWDKARTSMPVDGVLYHRGGVYFMYEKVNWGGSGAVGGIKLRAYPNETVIITTALSQPYTDPAGAWVPHPNVGRVTLDLFDDTAGTLLQSHTGNRNATWAKKAPYTANAQITPLGHVRAADSISGDPVYYVSGDPATADYDVVVPLLFRSSAGGFYILGRLSTASADTYYLFGYSTNDALWYLGKSVSNVYTDLGTWKDLTTPIPNRGIRMARLSMVGSTIRGIVDDIPRISVTDSSITAKGKAGFFWSDACTDTTGIHAVSFEIWDAGKDGYEDEYVSTFTVPIASPNVQINTPGRFYESMIPLSRPKLNDLHSENEFHVKETRRFEDDDVTPNSNWQGALYATLTAIADHTAPRLNTTLASQAVPGNTISVVNSTGWYVDQWISIGHGGLSPQPSRRQILSVAGNVITLKTAIGTTYAAGRVVVGEQKLSVDSTTGAAMGDPIFIGSGTAQEGVTIGSVNAGFLGVSVDTLLTKTHPVGTGVIQQEGPQSSVFNNRHDHPIGCYWGPGAYWNNADDKIYIRLRHTNRPWLDANNWLNQPGFVTNNYKGVTDPRLIKLLLCPYINDFAMIKIATDNMTIQGIHFTANFRVEVTGNNAVFEDCTTMSGDNPGLLNVGDGNKFYRCKMRGVGAPWTNRFLDKNRTTSPWTVSNTGDDFYYDRCEMTDTHDNVYNGPAIGNGVYIRCLFENYQDDGLWMPIRQASVKVVALCKWRQGLSAMPFTGQTGTQTAAGQGIYHTRNLYELRPLHPGTVPYIDSQDDPEEYDGWNLRMEHNTVITYPDWYVYGNTIVVPWQKTTYALDLAAVYQNAIRRVLNNILYQETGPPKVNIPVAAGDLQVGGNCMYARDGTPFVGGTPQPTDVMQDPQFVGVVPDWRDPQDYHLQPTSPCVGAGIVIPAWWPDPLIGNAAHDPSDPDIGAIPQGLNGEIFGPDSIITTDIDWRDVHP